MIRHFACLMPLLLAACGNSGSEQAPDNTPAEAPEDRPLEPVQFPAERQPGAPPPIAIPRISVATGVYVIAGTSCTNPANAAFRIYNGTGISGSATRDCRLENARYTSNRQSFDQSCVDTYSGERTTSPIEIAVTGPHSFTLHEGDETTRFVHCAAEDLPDFLKDAVGG